MPPKPRRVTKPPSTEMRKERTLRSASSMSGAGARRACQP